MDKLQLYKSLFKGREDVYAIHWSKGSKSGYMPAKFYDSYFNIDETSLSHGELFLVVANKRHVEKRLIVAILNETKSEDIIPVLLKITTRIVYRLLIRPSNANRKV